MFVRHPHAAAVDAVILQPATVVVEVRADRADEDRRSTEFAHRVADVAADPTAPDDEVLGEEAQRDVVEMVAEQLLGEFAGELHQMVGSDRATYINGHGGLQLSARRYCWATTFHATDRCHNASDRIPGVRECGRKEMDLGRTQLKESPQAQLPVAFGLSMVKPCFSMVSTKSMVAPWT